MYKRIYLFASFFVLSVGVSDMSQGAAVAATRGRSSDPKKKERYEPKIDKRRFISNAEIYGLIEPDACPSPLAPDSPNAAREVPMLIYDDGGGLEGFDLSHYQGNVNWDLLSEDNRCGFVYLKASEGNSLTDSRYREYFNSAKSKGLKVGSYHFFRSSATASEQFANFKSMVDRNHQDLIPLIDVETISRGTSMYQFHNRLQEFLQLVEHEYGRKPMIYTGMNFYNKHLYGGRYSGYKFMIACYTFEEPVLYDNDDFLIWQYTGTGRAQGVRGHIDISRFVRGHKLSEILYQ